MTSPSSRFLTAQMLGISTSLILSGGNFYMTSMTNRVLANPTRTSAVDALEEINQMFDDGAKVFPQVAIFSSACFAYLSYLSPAGSGSRVGYMLATALPVAIAPFTTQVMLPIVNKDFLEGGKVPDRKKGVEVAGGDEEMRRKLKLFGWLNAVRGALVAAGGVVGLYTALVL